MQSWKPIHERTSEELHQQAERFRQLAATARITDVLETLLELADEYDLLADQRPI